MRRNGRPDLFAVFLPLRVASRAEMMRTRALSALVAECVCDTANSLPSLDKPSVNQGSSNSLCSASNTARSCAVKGQVLLLAPDVFCPLSSGVMNPIGRLGGSGGVISSRSASKTCFN